MLWCRVADGGELDQKVQRWRNITHLSTHRLGAIALGLLLAAAQAGSLDGSAGAFAIRLLPPAAAGVAFGRWVAVAVAGTWARAGVGHPAIVVHFVGGK